MNLLREIAAAQATPSWDIHRETPYYKDTLSRDESRTSRPKTRSTPNTANAHRSEWPVTYRIASSEPLQSPPSNDRLNPPVQYAAPRTSDVAKHSSHTELDNAKLSEVYNAFEDSEMQVRVLVHEFIKPP